jgi:hypothetical protein
MNQLEYECRCGECRIDPDTGSLMGGWCYVENCINTSSLEALMAPADEPAAATSSSPMPSVASSPVSTASSPELVRMKDITHVSEQSPTPSQKTMNLEKKRKVDSFETPPVSLNVQGVFKDESGLLHHENCRYLKYFREPASIEDFVVNVKCSCVPAKYEFLQLTLKTPQREKLQLRHTLDKLYNVLTSCKRRK